MRRTILALAAAGLALTATACSSSGSDKAAEAAPPAATTPAAAGTGAPSTPAAAPATPAAPSGAGGGATAPAAAAKLDASAAVAALAKAVPSVKLTKAYTAEDDPNHLLGRPGQYVSKIAFADSRIKGADLEGADEDSIVRGGSIETFASETEAAARLGYLQGVIKALPAALEYDYVVRGTVLIRASKLLTPDQAKAYEAALKG
ncbi:hypothetical protein ACFVFS_17205 [Kitasatospora sp. NPDC057692]|uniref:hypothetical protein n=1 Tax=Kitasatospora sp. NPDC057692 TaxID=3346215 RepID=UPI003692AD68